MAEKEKEKKKTAPAAASLNPDKKKALETAIAKIERDYGKGTIMRLGDDIPVNVEALSTGSLSLDLALGIGGVPKGRIVEDPQEWFVNGYPDRRERPLPWAPGTSWR